VASLHAKPALLKNFRLMRQFFAFIQSNELLTEKSKLLKKLYIDESVSF